jgi:hypothetical protein
VIFATGVIVLFSSAIVYETFPSTHHRPPPPRGVPWHRHAGIKRVDARSHLRTSRDLRERSKP